MVEVVASLIWQGDTFIICHPPADVEILARINEELK